MLKSDIISEFFGFNNKFVIFNLVLKNLKLRYRKSILGIFWTMLIPAVTACVYYFVFQFVMKVKLPNYLLFILSGIIPWTFFTQSISMGLESIVGNHSILNKVPVAPNVFPLSETLTAFLNLCFSLPVLAFVSSLTGAPSSLNVLFVIPFLLLLGLQAYFIAVICGVLFVYLRDLRHIINIILQIWFYLTPVVYSLDMIPSQYQWVNYINPIGMVFHGIHNLLVFDIIISKRDFSLIIGWTILLGVFSLGFYFKQKKFLVERL